MINIIGAGLSGLSAAIALAKKGLKCNLISIQESQRAQSVMAEGGINAALNTMGEDDDVSQHFADTMKGGAYLNEESAVKGLTSAAPDIVLWLKDLGVPFEYKDGRIVQRNFGGQKKKRTAYVKSSTGKMLMSALIDEARKYEVKGLIYRYDHHRVYDILIEGHACKGLRMIDLYNDKKYECKGQVLVCSGGLTGFFKGHTTGSSDNDGQLSAILFSKGVAMANLEMIQYHPTTIAIPGKRMLVSEAARGEGGRLMTFKNGEPYYFMEELYPETGNLSTRDLTSRTIYQIMNEPSCKGVYLDLRHLDKKAFENQLSDMREELLEYLSIDIQKDFLPIEPGIHYFMGGIDVDDDHKTNIKGLYAAGECACKYHGANRLGGNSLLGAIYGGAKAAMNMEDQSDSEIHEIFETYDPTDETLLNKIKDILLQGLGIIRDEQGITKALKKIEALKQEGRNKSDEAAIGFAKAMLTSALNRKESRGAHYRLDLPHSDENYRKTSLVMYDEGLHFSYRDIEKRSSE